MISGLATHSPSLVLFLGGWKLGSPCSVQLQLSEEGRKKWPLVQIVTIPWEIYSVFTFWKLSCSIFLEQECSNPSATRNFKTCNHLTI